MSDLYFYVGGFVWGFFAHWLYAKRHDKLQKKRESEFHDNVTNDSDNCNEEQTF